MDTSSLNSLLQQSETSNSSNQLGTIMLFVTIASFVITIVIVVLWIMGWLHRRKVQDSILDIQKTLHEMNERDKARSAPPPAPRKSDDSV